MEMETENKRENSTQTSAPAPESQAPKTSRPPRSLYYFTFSLLAIVIVMKIVSCTALSKVNVMDEIQKTQNPPQVRIINN